MELRVARVWSVSTSANSRSRLWALMKERLRYRWRRIWWAKTKRLGVSVSAVLLATKRQDASNLGRIGEIG